MAGRLCFASSCARLFRLLPPPINARLPKNEALHTYIYGIASHHQNARMQNVTRSIRSARRRTPAVDAVDAIIFTQNPACTTRICRRPALSRTRTARSRKRTPSPRGLTTRGSDPSTRGSRIADGQSTPPSQTCRRWRHSSSWLAPRVSSRRWNPLTRFTTPCRCVCIHLRRAGGSVLGCRPLFLVVLVDMTKMDGLVKVS